MMQLNAIKQMEAYARNHDDVVSLSQGIPFRNSDESIRSAAITAILQSKVDKYADPQGIVGLRKVISRDLHREGMAYTENEILITAGAIEGLTATFLTLLTSEKDEVIIPTPTYSAYFRAVNVARGKTVFLQLDEKNNWALDLKALEKKITQKTAAILLCNPNNPTGTIYSKVTLDAVCLLAEKYGIKIILDEVYSQMIFDNKSFYTPCIQKQFKENVIRIVSFSKDFSLTGWRVGFLHAPESFIEKVLPIHDALINCVPVVSQYAAIAAIENKKRIVAENKEIYVKNRNVMKAYLDKVSEYATYMMPQGSYFFFPKIKNVYNSKKFCLELLTTEQVTIVPGSDFGPGGEGHVRICFGRSEESIHEGMSRVTKYMRNML